MLSLYCRCLFSFLLIRSIVSNIAPQSGGNKSMVFSFSNHLVWQPSQNPFLKLGRVHAFCFVIENVSLGKGAGRERGDRKWNKTNPSYWGMKYFIDSVGWSRHVLTLQYGHAKLYLVRVKRIFLIFVFKSLTKVEMELIPENPVHCIKKLFVLIYIKYRNAPI